MRPPPREEVRIIITDNADGQLKMLPLGLLSKKFEGARGRRLCLSTGAPVPWHNGTMASPSLISNNVDVDVDVRAQAVVRL